MMFKFFIILILLFSNIFSAEIPSIKVCSAANNMPFEDFDKNGKYIGMVSSYFDIFKKKLNIKIDIVKTQNFQESLKYLKNNKCDAISIAATNPNKDKLLATTAYIITPIVLAIKSPVPFITDFYNLKNKKLIIDKNAPYKQELLTDYSNINDLTDISSTREALKSVDKGEVFGAIGTLAEIGYYFYQDYMGELKIAGKTDHVDLKLSMIFREDKKDLYNLFEKAIKNLDKSIHYDIVSKWTSISYGIGIPAKIIYIGTIVVLLIFLIIGLFIFILKRKIKKAIKINHEKDKYLFLQSRLAHIGELLSMISHQWRQPLGVMSTIIIKMQLSNENKEFDNDLKDMDKYIQYLSNTLSDFRNFYKPNKDMSNLDITIPIQDALNIIQPLLDKHDITLHTNFDSHTKLNIFSNELTQVILIILQNSIDNFIDNFIDKNRNQPTITITTQNKSNNSVVLEIADNGGGIDTNIIDKIFEPYFSTKIEKNGTGLGLYMAKLIIENYHNGELKVKDTQDGIVFNINLFL